MEKAKIYKITCIPNGRFYIGATIRAISIRYSEHKQKTNNKMKIDVDKYGWENFTIETIFEGSKYECFEIKEIEYIEKLKPYYNTKNSMEVGNSQKGEESSNHELSNKQIEEIRYKYKNGISQNVLAIEYNTTQSNISLIVSGKTWDNVFKRDILTKKEIKFIKSELSEIDIIEIRNKYNNGTTQKELKKQYNYNNISDIVLGKKWKEIPGPIAKPISGIGENHSNTKISDREVVEIRERCKDGESQKHIAKDFPQTTYSNINYIVLGKSRKEAGGPIKGIDY